jgi:uncharacterized protein (TIGR02996 family)
MTHDEAFLQDILAHPDDGMPRLIYADWLEDRGDARFEYLRLEQALAAAPLEGRLSSTVWGKWLDARCTFPLDWMDAIPRFFNPSSADLIDEYRFMGDWDYFHFKDKTDFLGVILEVSESTVLLGPSGPMAEHFEAAVDEIDLSILHYGIGTIEWQVGWDSSQRRWIHKLFKRLYPPLQTKTVRKPWWKFW